MFGERYFATRQRLIDVVAGVQSLGDECATETSELEAEGSSFQSLLNPFLWIVCGEVNSGKSTLLNALFGQSICPVSDIPDTKTVQHYHVGPVEKNVGDGPDLEHRFRRLDLLRDFHLVDTPGTNKLSDGQLTVIEGFLPVADVLLFVFPVENPWGAATWQLISRLPESQLENAVFVLQQCDLKDEADIEVILGHIRTLAEQKLGFLPVVYPVSGKMAMEAKHSETGSSHLWRKSGFPPLESHISRRILSNPARQEILRESVRATESVLRRIEEQIDTRTSNLDSDERFLRELENELDARREGVARDLSGGLTGLGDVFLNEGKKAAIDLSAHMAIPQSIISLFKEETIPSTIEKSLIEAVKKAVEQRATNDGGDLVQSCRTHWETVVPRLRENLDVNAPDFEKDTESLAGASNRFVERLGVAARHAVGHLRIRSALDMQMENRRIILRQFMIGVLCSLIFAGVSGGLGWSWWPWIGVGIGFLTLLAAAGYAATSRKFVCRDFIERLEDLRQPFANSLTDDYKDGVREFYVEYGGLFEIVRRRIVDQKLLLKPRLERWNNLFLELKAIDQEI